MKKVLPLILVAAIGSLLHAQSTNGSITGRVTDPTKSVVPKARIVLINTDTNSIRTLATDEAGSYHIASVAPGNYRMEVEKQGFRTVIKPGLIVHVQDALEINFELALGAASETITVEGGAPLINTQDASVGTIIDRKFVENIPLNGRSFQSLITLTPGIVSNSPQQNASFGVRGEFSVNGQRAESNYYTVDGVAATGGVNAFAPSVGSTGQLPLSTSLGTTQGLVSLDALEEFRVVTSSFSAEYGRSPGGHFAFSTRSGTNNWHGSGFDYLRNDALDANNWFNNHLGTEKQPLRQNDFGGTLSGPIQIPGVFNGKNRTFFFFSYEGLRLDQSQAAATYYVPSLDMRQAAPAAVQPLLNSFPVPTGAALDNGLAPWVGGITIPGSIDATSVRIDHSINSRNKAFFRFSDTSSNGATSSTYLASQLNFNNFVARSYTAGLNSQISNRINNEFRWNWGQNRGDFINQMTGVGGAQPADWAQLQGIDTEANPAWQVYYIMFFSGYISYAYQGNSSGEQRQWNLTDNLNWSLGSHQLKFGVDYLRTTPFSRPQNPYIVFEYFSQDSVLANQADYSEVDAQPPSYPLWRLFSAYAEDEWHATPRLHVSMGLRWELDPPPGVASGPVPYTLQGDINTPSSLKLAGRSLWKTTYHNFAPRLGVAYSVSDKPGRETVLRGGGGVFFDTGEQDSGNSFVGGGYRNIVPYFGASFPLTPDQLNVPVPYPPVPPYSTQLVLGFPPHLQLPYTLQWNVSVQQGLGNAQALTMSYVGTVGRRLLQQRLYSLDAVNPDFGSVFIYENGPTSDYHALQAQLQRRLSHGLQALISYTWSHLIDYGSQDQAFPAQRGNSNFDVRHNLTAGLSYDLPRFSRQGWMAAVLNNWGTDVRFVARTSFPITMEGDLTVLPGTNTYAYLGLNQVLGAPVYLYDPKYPGGRVINPAAFTNPPAGTLATTPRNFVRGFGLNQTDFALRREFTFAERIKLQVRAEAFNVFNHPNFGLINTTYGNPLFGQATQTLNQSLGLLSAQYQPGGPRSMQIALKLLF